MNKQRKGIVKLALFSMMIMAMLLASAQLAAAQTNTPPRLEQCAGSLTTPVNLSLTVGQTITFRVSFVDDDVPDQTLTMTVTGFPSGAVATPPFPVVGSVVITDITWTPNAADIGTHTITFTATDNGDGNLSATCVVSITVEQPTCPLTQGYWKTHPEAWPVASLTLGSQTYTQAELLNILNMSVKGDASLILAHQLIAAKLNVANGAPPGSINSTIAAGDALVAGFSGKLPYSVAPSSSVGQQMVGTARSLDSYNNGALTPGCGGI